LEIRFFRTENPDFFQRLGQIYPVLCVCW